MEKRNEFMEKVKADETLKAEITKILSGEQEGRTEKIIAFAKENGFEFTAEEIEKVLNPMEGELADEELDNVAGGVCAPNEKIRGCYGNLTWSQAKKGWCCVFGSVGHNKNCFGNIHRCPYWSADKIDGNRYAAKCRKIGEIIAYGDSDKYDIILDMTQDNWYGSR